MQKKEFRTGLSRSNCLTVGTGPLLKHRGRLYPVRTTLLALHTIIFAIRVISCQQQRQVSDTPRYIITSPEVGELFYLLQGTQNVVGVAEHVNYPAAFLELPKVGGFGGVSIERVLNLNPTLVLTSSLEQEKTATELEKMGIEVLSVYPGSIDEMLNNVIIIAKAIGAEERGAAVRDSLRNEIESIRAKQTARRPRVYVEIYGDPIMSVSKKSFIGELIELAGGDNIFDVLPRDYSRIRQEDVIAANPEIILLTYPFITAEQIVSRKGWQHIDAIANRRIYSTEDVNQDLIIRAGPRSIEGAKILRNIFSKDNDGITKD